MTEIKARLAAYDHICRVYDDYLKADSGMDRLACQKGCAACCTINVTVTSLEAWRIATFMEEQGRSDLFDRLSASVETKRFQPQITLNRMAEIYKQGGDVPEEDLDPAWGACPLLMPENSCAIYDVRPFACRCLVSTEDCNALGYSQMSEFTLTVNNIMLQYLEHIDLTGFTGNLLDMILYMKTEEHKKKYLAANGDRPEIFIANSPATVLLVPQEEKRQVEPLLRKLNNTDL